MTLSVKTSAGGYDIICERGALSRVGELLNLSRKVLIVTDDGVPAQYAESVAKACYEPHIVTLACGEGSKSIASLRCSAARCSCMNLRAAMPWWL